MITNFVLGEKTQSKLLNFCWYYNALVSTMQPTKLNEKHYGTRSF